MKRWGIYSLVMLVAGFLVKCIDPFNPPQIQQASAYLVVDGFVDVDGMEVEIRLTRTQNLADASAPPVESGAQVSIEINGGTTYLLSEESPGIYTRSGLLINFNDQCKLIINTGGKDYESDIVKAIQTPDIDSVTYKVDDSGVRIDVTTHDPANTTWYYKWQYEETIQYYSKFYSGYYYRGPGDYPNRPASDNIYQCWKTNESSTILVATSSGLREDVIFKFPVTFLPSTSWKLSSKYSILVKQYAIDKSTYQYWTELKKNTETVGSLFDPQPSEVTSNIRCVSDLSEPVLGNFGVRSTKEKRIYLTRGIEIPSYDVITGYEQCSPFAMDTVLLADLNAEPGRYLLLQPVYPEGSPFPIGFTTHQPLCIDCRILHKGTTQRPDFWE